MGTWNSTGQQELSENIKTFVDDMHDHQIINISKHAPYREDFVPRQLRNRHGAYMTGVTGRDMERIREYCLFLIDIGAVDYVLPTEETKAFMEEPIAYAHSNLAC